MELKPRTNTVMHYGPLGFNRTFMELKPLNYIGRSLEELSFNRTFMELKRLRVDIRRSPKLVLIEPLWN